MGQVKEQAFKNSVIQYIGIALGYVNTILLFPKIFDADQYGLTRIFLAIATFYVSFGSLGSFKTVVRFFPFFSRNYKNNSVFLLSFWICLVGYIALTLIYIAFEGPILENYKEKSSLFIDNYMMVIPLAFTMLFFQLFESYMIAIKKTVFSFFLRNILLRLLWMAEIIMYYYQLIDFTQFLTAFIYSYGIILVLIFAKVLKEKEITFKFFGIKKRVFRVMVSYSVFSIISGISSMLVTRIDTIMIWYLVGLKETAVYAIASYMTSVIMVPMQAINRITSPIIAADWKAKRMKSIGKLYKQTSISQLIIGGWVFICIWTNIEEVFTFFPEEYYEGKYVVLLLGFAILLNMIMGMNGNIMNLSKYYKLDTYASLGLAFFTILFNLYFIPLYGVVGAAMATLLSISLYNIFRFTVILSKLKMQPFSFDTLKVLLLLVALGVSFSYFPVTINEYYLLTIIIKSALISIIFFPIIYFLEVFPEMNVEVTKLQNKFRRR